MCYRGALDKVKQLIRVFKEISTEILQGKLSAIWSLSCQQMLSTYYMPFLYQVLELNKTKYTILIPNSYSPVRKIGS